ncbi:hypothetical protein [Plantactinospora sp. KBS50]|uniref:hypothetical protein n=1 Tax=Plantactinospora sp. KBS50 TaxID=2024580 RepID=UPI000BAB0178|nr:hypothetical protein [Plantactinospora sp. KBS50]ASW53137.1 hypothetical protein CIK06_01465 [Plantactinospora sp. KBS50]
MAMTAEGNGPDLDDVAREALLSWSDRTGARLELEAEFNSGMTDASVYRATVEIPGDGFRAVVVKRCRPRGDGVFESERLVRARAANRAFAAAHLAEQAYDPIALPDGGTILLQQVAGDDLRDNRTLAQALSEPGGWQRWTDKVQTLAGQLLTEWNAGVPTPVRTDAKSLLRSMLGDFRLSDRGAIPAWLGQRAPEALETGNSWLNLADERGPQANPWSLASSRNDFGEPVEIRNWSGLTHGDLHPGNIIVPRRAQRTDSFWLIDLSRFASDSPLARDQVYLCLTALGPRVATCGLDAQAELIDLVIDPQGVEPLKLEPEVATFVRKMRSAGDSWLAGRGVMSYWHDLILLALCAEGLILASRRSTPPALQTWYFRVACRAATALLAEHYRPATRSSVAPAAIIERVGSAAAPPLLAGPRLLREAERLARQIPSEVQRGSALAEVAKAVATTQPDDAERIADSTGTDFVARAAALTGIASVLVQGDATRANRLLAQAARAARHIADGREQAIALVRAATVLAELDPTGAERMVALATEPFAGRGSALANLVAVLAVTDRAAALRVAEKAAAGADAGEKTVVAEAVAGLAPERAERLLQDSWRIARSDYVNWNGDIDYTDIDGPPMWLLGRVAAAAIRILGLRKARPYLTEAERAVRACRCDDCAARALELLAEARAEADPESAIQVFADDPYRSLWSDLLAAVPSPRLLGAMSRFQPGHAEMLARSLPDAARQGESLLAITVASTTNDVGYAQTIAESIEDSRSRALALAAVAEVVSDHDRAAGLLTEAESAARLLADPTRVGVLLRIARAWQRFDG